MRKSWSAKGFSNKNRPLSKSTRLLVLKDTSSTSKLKSLLNTETSNSLLRPITAGSFWATARTFPQLPPSIEIEGLTRCEVQRIYAAKCLDLDIANIKDQEQRFFSFCSKSFTNRMIGLNENGLGLESIKVISSILKRNSYFCRVNLAKNNIGELGAVHLASALRRNRNIITLDISSNDINSEGCSRFFDNLKSNDAIVYINIASLEGLHRNRMGVKGAESLSEFLKTNRTLTHLNIGDTGIGKEGFEHLIQGIAHNNVIVSLDISNNGFTFQSLDNFCNSLITTCLKELNLSGNKISNKGCEILATMLQNKLNKPSTLTKLELANCDITSYGICKLFDSLENNPNVYYLNVDNNNLGQYSGPSIGKCLSVNSAIETLLLNGCNLRDENFSKVSEGMCKNFTVKKLSLWKNSLTDSSAENIAEILRKNSRLVTLDLSYNLMKNKGGIIMANALRANSTIENLILTENSLKDESGRLLAEISRFKNNLLKVDLKMNPINLKYIKEIKENLQRNNFHYKSLISPRIKKEIEKLTMSEGEIEGVYLKIEDKAKEKVDFEEKIQRHKAKLQHTIDEEKEKFDVIKDEFNEIKEESQALSSKLDTILYEITRLKFQTEKETNERTELVALIIQDIRRLEKLKAQTKEEFGMKRAQLNNTIQDLNQEKKDVDIIYNSAVSSLSLAQSKVFEMNKEILFIQDPTRLLEEAKIPKRKKRNTKIFRSQKSLRFQKK